VEQAIPVLGRILADLRRRWGTCNRGKVIDLNQRFLASNKVLPVVIWFFSVLDCSIAA